MLDRYDFLPFGEAWLPPTNPDRRQFAGKERDVETGLDYFGARHHMSTVGRFTTVDPVMNVEAAMTDPQRWNRYAYARNNPLKFIDPDGRDITTPAAFQQRAFAQQVGANLQALGKAAVNIVRSLNSPGHMTPDAEAGYFEQPDSPAEASRMQFFDLALAAAPALFGARSTGSTFVAEEVGILRGMARGRGDFGLGSATADDAARMGRAWVGKGHTVAKDGSTLVSQDGLRQYRPPSYKPRLNKVQASPIDPSKQRSSSASGQSAPVAGLLKHLFDTSG